MPAHLGFTASHPDKARLIHAAPYTLDLGPYAERIAAAKASRLSSDRIWLSLSGRGARRRSGREGGSSAVGWSPV
ncbi:hypothetical protein ABT158_34530 [Nonomuraea sp. NPDC001636]|uniref:hypothetical protein n=1 Tax=Nonomuraea sp. NPDC001636 TaxID=3154391 RepID=UPI0033346B86